MGKERRTNDVEDANGMERRERGKGEDYKYIRDGKQRSEMEERGRREEGRGWRGEGGSKEVRGLHHSRSFYRYFDRHSPS